MITPSAVQNKDFTKGVRGYKEDEVDKFLDQIAHDLDTVLQENRVLKEKLMAQNEELMQRNEVLMEQNEELEKYRSSEGSIFATLESARAFMGDISASAEKRAEVVLKNAELEAQRIEREAKESVGRITEEAVEMAHRWDQFKQRYKTLLQDEMERFENLNADLLIETNNEKSNFYSDFTSRPMSAPTPDTIDPIRSNRPVMDGTLKNIK